MLCLHLQQAQNNYCPENFAYMDGKTIITNLLSYSPVVDITSVDQANIRTWLISAYRGILFIVVLLSSETRNIQPQYRLGSKWDISLA